MTNTTALVNPAIVRMASQPIVLLANGIAANVATSTMSDARQAIAERVSRLEAVPANAPARYPT
jgi:hypothetical protein